VVLLLRLAIGDGGLGLDLAASSCSGSESVSESSTYSLDLGVTPLRPPLHPQKEEKFKPKNRKLNFLILCEECVVIGRRKRATLPY
jgi:hypothetical protein